MIWGGCKNRVVVGLNLSISSLFVHVHSLCYSTSIKRSGRVPLCSQTLPRMTASCSGLPQLPASCTSCTSCRHSTSTNVKRTESSWPMRVNPCHSFHSLQYKNKGIMNHPMMLGCLAQFSILLVVLRGNLPPQRHPINKVFGVVRFGLHASSIHA